jgi:hypothetical protein
MNPNQLIFKRKYFIYDSTYDNSNPTEYSPLCYFGMAVDASTMIEKLYVHVGLQYGEFYLVSSDENETESSYRIDVHFSPSAENPNVGSLLVASSGVNLDYPIKYKRLKTKPGSKRVTKETTVTIKPEPIKEPKPKPLPNPVISPTWPTHTVQRHIPNRAKVDKPIR